ncbi:hypothetical protein KC332_g8730 [Hortaea werneckii]|uniref:F-box domain-containing protein n=2 Tax=Hortaea werneckii TaxID=91943 RepID=A0A3M7IAG3_HORWE|nr:hypothetical protein KC358_g6920 [Hortaea werneckii]OTA38814.1 hypothetical protein BTJ68_01410 [Hortaea werneckii EXF-2000]KAI6834060.1 hypothetical protein KC350_g6803 [Hortaea werneckii]KAI6923887.1 hypothetical protein KC341_g14425 [Hortaea werneckii]KAI6931072.1 hypothetical protein KC348_g7374 [Hortaea werneckii]
MALLQLPPELLLRMSDCLTTSELGNLRLTCKAVESTLFDTFAKEFFTKRQFMIEQNSLQTLLDIANHPTLSPWLTQVIIGADVLRHSPDMAHRSSCANYRAEYLERQTLLNTGLACEMLVEAFSKLPNLQTVGLRDYYGGCSGSGRERDGPNAVWRSYGWSCNMSEDEYQDQKGLSRHLTTIFDIPGPLLPLILQALGRANARPQNLETFLRRRSKLVPLSFDVFNRLMAPSIIPILAGIQRLMLSISELNLGSAGPGVDSSEEKTRSLLIQQFLEHTPNLQCLRLNFASDRSSADSILEWLGRRPHLSSFKHSPIVVRIPAVQFNNLTELDLGMVSIHKTALVDVITKFNLKSLNLWKVSIKEPKDFPEDEVGSLWPSFFTTLAERLLSNTLQSLMVGWPASLEYEQGTPHVEYTAMRFMIDGNHENRKPENVTPIVRYQAVFGSDVQDWLKETAAKVATLDHIEGPLSSDSEDMDTALELESDDFDYESDDDGEM